MHPHRAVKHVDRAFVPLIWFEINAEVNRDLGMLINLALQVPVFGLAFFFALFCLGLVAVTVSSVLIIRRRSIAKTIIASLGMEKSDNILHKEGGRYDQLNLKV